MGFSPNDITFSCILKACGIDRGKQIYHGIIHMKCLNKLVKLDNVQLWTVLIVGYVQRGEGSKALVDMYVKCGEGKWNR